MTSTGESKGHLVSRPRKGGAKKQHASSPRPPHGRYRRVLSVVGTLILTVITFAAILAAGAVATNRSLHQSAPSSGGNGPNDGAEPAASHVVGWHGRPLVVAFVAGTAGTVASDLLAPYDIFASSRAFRPYVVAAHAGPIPLEGGPALVPTHTFAEVDADPTLTPDLVVVPALSTPTGKTESPLREWVTRQHDDGARVLGVCAGSVVLADTGMLDGLHATSHWSRISALQHTRPAVHWVKGRRWVEEGSVTTTAAVSSGVPAALHLVAELAGPVEAQRVASQHPELGWSPHESTVIAKDHFGARDWPVGLDFVEPWFRPTVGIALTDGVDELDATAAFEVYTQSAAARTVAVATGDTVRTRHGLTLSTTSAREVPSMSRVVIPGADAVDPRLKHWADDHNIEVEPLVHGLGSAANGRSGGGFAAALQNLTDHTDAATATSTAKMIGYPTSDLDLQRGHTAVRPLLLLVATLILALLVGLAPSWVTRHRRRRASSSSTRGSTSDQRANQ